MPRIVISPPLLVVVYLRFVERTEPGIAFSRVDTTPHRIVRILAILLGGMAGVVLGLVILAALGRPAGAASLPLGSSPASILPVAVPGVSVPALSVTRVQPVPTIASVTQVVTPKVTDVPRSAAKFPAGGPAVASNTAGSLAAQVLAAGNAAAAPIGVGLGTPMIPLLGGVPNIVSNASGAIPISIGAFQPWGIGNAAIANTLINGPSTAASRVAAWGNRRALPAPLAPNRGPTTPYPFSNSLLAANDLSGDSAAGQGGGPFGSGPPASILLPMLALAGVLLARGTKPQLLLDSRCSPPG
jgi:hypothetical protein